MSIQDDYYDLRDDLKDQPEALVRFERIWEVFCDNEAELLRLREFKSTITETMKLLKTLDNGEK